MSDSKNKKLNSATCLKTLVMLTRIPILVFDKNGHVVERYENISRPVYENDQNILNEMQRRLETEYFVFEEYDSYLPVAICGCSGDKFNYILGPFAYGNMDSKNIQLYMKRKKITEFPNAQIRECLLVANMILNEFSNEYNTVDVFKEFEDANEHQQIYSLIDEELRQIDTFQENHTHAEEDELYDAIEKGEAEFLKLNYDILNPPHPIVLDEVYKNEEYMAAIGISLAARAAIRGGLTSKEGYLLNDIYLKKLSKCKSIIEMHSLVKEMHIHCARQVYKKRQFNATNKYVEKCKKIIISKRFKTIELQDIADEIGISKEYMSKLFKKHEGIPILEYIIDIKMEAACNMLKYSDRQINEIAEYLSFTSLSYFSRLFKKKTGMAPQKYRQKYQRDSY